MWLFTTFGFFSIVKHHTTPRTFVVRGRIESDLRAARAVCQESWPVAHTPDHDYAWRFDCSPADLGQLLTAAAMSVDYPNFKAAVLRAQGAERERAYHGVWATIADAFLNWGPSTAPRRPRSGPPRRARGR